YLYIDCMQTLFPPDTTLPIHRLAACFNSTSATYKFYWLLAILDAIQEQKRDYVYWNLSLFLQVRNPNVPDIPNKLIKPAMRNSLTKQRKFWDYVIDKNGPLKCIYTGKELHKGKYHVEHFVPYSFVSHDQIWNLIPSDNSFNISKSNKLPPLNHMWYIKILIQKTK